MPIDDTLAEKIWKFQGQPTLILTEPEVLDFTNLDKPAQLILRSEKNGLKFFIPKLKRDLIESGVSQVSSFIDQGQIFLGWNLKSIFSYHLARTGSLFLESTKLFDLKILERMMGIEGKKPETFEEAKVRLAKIIQQPNWSKLKNIYQEVYIPLISQTLPKIESFGLAHRGVKEVLHTYYEIEGAVSGRMTTPQAFKRCYQAHSMDQEFRKHLYPLNCNFTDFIYFDYKQMEVCVLQWLSGDELLGQLIETNQDIYQEIWKQVTGSNNREMCKSVFLPICFGMGAKAVAKRLSCSEGAAELLINNFRDLFPTAMEYLDNLKVVDGIFEDSFGRLHKIEQDYLARNRAIQSTASVICLHKLVKLSQNLPDNAHIAFHLHDGYCIVSDRLNRNQVQKQCQDILESDDELYPNICLRVSCKGGESFDDLHQLRE